MKTLAKEILRLVLYMVLGWGTFKGMKTYESIIDRKNNIAGAYSQWDHGFYFFHCKDGTVVAAASACTCLNSRTCDVF